jgi:hypothetical protein
VQQPPLLTYRGGWLNSRDYMPDLTAIAKLGFDVMPFSFVVFDTVALFPSGVLGPQQTAYGKYSTPEQCWLTHLTASSSQVAGFAVTFYDTDRQELWAAQPILFPCSLGSAQKPFWLRRPYVMPTNAQLQVKVTNLSGVSNAIQIACWGVRR